MKSHASVRWSGNFKQGEGQISTDSGVLNNISYSVAKRFEGEAGTNPEELLAASHAACYSMALAAEFSKSYEVRSIETSATVTLEKDGAGFRITGSHLQTKADIADISEEEFEQKAQMVKSQCPISKALSIEISLEARLADLSSSVDEVAKRQDPKLWKDKSQNSAKNSWIESSD